MCATLTPSAGGPDVDLRLGAVAHEFRTPLHAILGFAELLDVPERTGEDLEAIAHIISSGQRMLVLVEWMLSMTPVGSDPHRVADASDRTNAFGPGFPGPELLAQVGDVDVDDVVVADPTRSPHALQQLRA